MTSSKCSTVFNPYIEGVEIANGVHGGTLRMHIELYLSQKAQADLTAIAKEITGLEDATLLGDGQTIILIADPPCDNDEAFKRLYRSFAKALETWFSDLTNLETEQVTEHLDFRDAVAIYSSANPIVSDNT